MTVAPERARIAQVGPDPEGPGGMEAMLGDLLHSPLAEQYRFDLIVSYRTPHPVRRLLVFARALIALARWCRGAGPRLAHIHTAVRGSIYRKALCVAVVKQAQRPVLLHLHAGAGDIAAFAARQGPLRLALLRRALAAADVVVSVSSAGAAAIERDFGAVNVTVVPNAAPSGQGRPVASGERRRLLFMGGFDNPAKGGAVLARSLPRILEQCPDLELVLAGSGELPAAVAALRERHPGIEWTGWLDRESKASQLSRCDIFVMPSLSEGMPIALLEAMVHNQAIVASAVGGIPDVVGESAAVLVPPDDPDALATAIARVVHEDDLRRSLGAAAAERVKEFAPERIYARYEAIYADLLAPQ